MFQSFTNYLMGSLLGVENSSSITLRPEDQGQTLRPEGQDKEEEWVMVDAEEDADEEEGAYADNVEYDIPRVPRHYAGELEYIPRRYAEQVEYDIPPHRSITRTSSESSLQSGSVMEESWFITPPPCFTSEGPILSTSPLENLLIEHPSMSVYHFNSSSTVYFTVTNPSRSDDEDEDEHEEDEEFEELAPPAHFRPAPVQNIQFPPNCVLVVEQEEKERYHARRAQKLQMKTAQKQFRRGYLVRNNKAREVNSRNHRQRRGERSQGANRSHANNNRKC